VAATSLLIFPVASSCTISVSRAGTEITVAVDERWLLICGDADHKRGTRVTEEFGECAIEDGSADAGNDEGAGDAGSMNSDESYRVHDCDGQSECSLTQIHEHDQECRVPGVPAPRPLCVAALLTKVDPGRSVAVLSNGLLAIRVGKAGR
jgi:hypothetical protein